jgi:hypothetical protein
VRQHLIARLAVGAFFDSVFAPDEATRAGAQDYLRKELGRDFPEGGTVRGQYDEVTGSRCPTAAALPL